MSGYEKEMSAQLTIDGRARSNTISVLEKPFSPEELLERVAQALAGSVALSVVFGVQ